MEEDTEPAEREQPPALAPADEAMLARAHTLYEITEAALRDVAQTYPADDHGSVLRDALFIQGLAEQLVDQAVVAERERGASWADIGEAASSSRQSAHERWASDVAAWVLMGRKRTGIGRGPADPEAHARDLDAWYSGLLGGADRPISRTLPSLRDEDARRQADARRAEVPRLNRRLDELRRETLDAYEAAFAATGTDQHEAKGAAWAAKHLAQAEVYDRLADIEEPVAAEHRRSAAAQRSIAQQILGGRAPQDFPTAGGIREQVYAAYADLTPRERSGSKRAVAALLAERLDGIGVDSVRSRLDAVVEAYREKERMTYLLDLAACSDPQQAVETAAGLLERWAQPTNNDFWHSQSRRLLSGYLMAAALSDADIDTVYDWIAHPDDRRPVELLRTGPVPEWADDCEQILTSPPKTRVNVLLAVRAALEWNLPGSAGRKGEGR
ncbi:hypothetical protein [Streptomyces sp. NPDC048192]|uniref:hypothetical protein n=1 Tax=Streptomyces sp. NPDC048192 TaxID=3365510 RepID=UPI003723BF7A